MRVLLVEDDRMIGDALIGHLQDEAYAVDWVRDGEAALHAALTQSYDVVLLDLGLPRLSGEAFLDRLRGTGDTTAVIVITARDSVSDRVAGLDAGADDYVVKPFAAAELMARVRTILRRGTGQDESVLVGRGVALDTITRIASVPGRDPVALTRREFAVLRSLLARPGVIVTVDQLEARVYGAGEEVDSNAIEYLIHRLRAKLGADVIRNVRGVGWLIPKREKDVR